LLTAIGVIPSGSSTVHMYTQTVQQQYSIHVHTNSTAAVQYTCTHKQYSSSTVHMYTQTVQQQYSTHVHTNSTQNNTMKQNTQNGTYITVRIHKHNNKKYIIYKIKQKHTKHTTIYTMIQNGAKEHEIM
jgi:hypothetical protein